jgi:hypothetical protein
MTDRGGARDRSRSLCSIPARCLVISTLGGPRGFFAPLTVLSRAIALTESRAERDYAGNPRKCIRLGVISKPEGDR